MYIRYDDSDRSLVVENKLKGDDIGKYLLDSLGIDYDDVMYVTVAEGVCEETVRIKTHYIKGDEGEVYETICKKRV